MAPMGRALLVGAVVIAAGIGFAFLRVNPYLYFAGYVVLQYVVISPSGREILVRTPVAAATPLEPGSPVWCTWDADAVQVFPDGEARA